MRNVYFWFIVGYVIFTLLLGNYMTSSVFGHMESYNENCNESFKVPQIQFIEPRDQSYYFENEHPNATCDNLNFLVYFMGGLTLFVVGSGLFQLIIFIRTCEVSIVVRKRF